MSALAIHIQEVLEKEAMVDLTEKGDKAKAEVGEEAASEETEVAVVVEEEEKIDQAGTKSRYEEVFTSHSCFPTMNCWFKIIVFLTFLADSSWEKIWQEVVVDSTSEYLLSSLHTCAGEALQRI